MVDYTAYQLHYASIKRDTGAKIMNADAMMKYGHQTLMEALNPVDESILQVRGACGYWSIKDILAHLTSYEWLMVDIFAQINGASSSPTLDLMFEQGDDFNNNQVDSRFDKSYNLQLTEYLAAHTKAISLLEQIPEEKRHEKGLVAWYGAEYDLEDIIVYMNYAHKREHSAQIHVFKDNSHVAKTVEMKVINPLLQRV